MFFTQQKSKQLHTHKTSEIVKCTCYTPTRSYGSCFRHPRTAHLGLPFLQKGLESLLCGSTFVIVAYDQDDVVPAELTHHVEPHVCLVRVRRHCAQEGKMDTLRGRKQNGGRKQKNGIRRSLYFSQLKNNNKSHIPVC